jgi:hypothetical protein
MIPSEKKDKFMIRKMLKLNDLTAGYENGRDNVFTQYCEIDDEADIHTKNRMMAKAPIKRNHRRNSH